MGRYAHYERSPIYRGAKIRECRKCKRRRFHVIRGDRLYCIHCGTMAWGLIEVTLKKPLPPFRNDRLAYATRIVEEVLAERRDACQQTELEQFRSKDTGAAAIAGVELEARLENGEHA